MTLRVLEFWVQQNDRALVWLGNPNANLGLLTSSPALGHGDSRNQFLDLKDGVSTHNFR
jgi:hypothetical protein